MDTQRYFLTCCRYIELNPVRAGPVALPEEYRWSSHCFYALGREDALLTAQPARQERQSPHFKTGESIEDPAFAIRRDRDDLADIDAYLK